MTFLPDFWFGVNGYQFDISHDLLGLYLDGHRASNVHGLGRMKGPPQLMSLYCDSSSKLPHHVLLWSTLYI